MAKRRREAISEIETVADIEKVQRRAYEIYESRGRRDGAALDDWLQAEHELLDAEERQTIPSGARGM